MFFQSGCTECHDAERATSKRKSLGGWIATVRRMAAKEDADIPSSQHVAIATYLASLNPAARPSGDGGSNGETDMSGGGADLAAAADVPAFSLNGTISPVWRGTDRDVENKGFFADAWVGIEWRPPENPVSGRVTACTSCHGTNTGHGFELVEASATINLMHWWTGCTKSDRDGCLEAAIPGWRRIALVPGQECS